MRFIHTADWHLGKSLKSQSLIEDQRYILKNFLKIVDDSKVDAIVIAGDIYDRNVPPEEAVNLFDQVLNELILERGLHVLCIAGNHDSEGRLNFGNKLFDNSKFHIRAKLTNEIEPIILNDEFGEVYFSMIPYFEPSKVKVTFNIDDDSELTFDEAAALLVKAARSKIPANARSVAVTHAFIAGGVESGSERKLPGGAGQVSPHHFKDFNYTALEWKQSKSVTLVDIDGAGNVDINNDLPLVPLRDVRIIKGKVSDILNSESNSEDYISIQYQDVMTNIQNALLRKKFINLLEIKPIDRVLTNAIEGARQIENISHIEHFKNFFKYATGNTMSDKEISVITELIEDIEKE